jgi:hypothetical protein
VADEKTSQPDAEHTGKKHPLRYRIVGVVLGLAILFTGLGTLAVQGVHAVEATGLVGERGKLTVKYCYESSGRMWPEYRCRGTFDPAAAGDDVRDATVENADDEPKGTQLDVVEGHVGSEGYFRETGAGATLGSLLWLCFGLLFVPWGYSTTRKWAKGHQDR